MASKESITDKYDYADSKLDGGRPINGAFR